MDKAEVKKMLELLDAIAISLNRIGDQLEEMKLDRRNEGR